MQKNRVTFFEAATAAAYSHAYSGTPKIHTFHAEGATTAGAGASDVKVWGSNKQAPDLTDDKDWVLLGTISLVLSTTRAGGGFVSDAPWTHVRAEIDSISGTGANVDVYMGVSE